MKSFLPISVILILLIATCSHSYIRNFKTHRSMPAGGFRNIQRMANDVPDNLGETSNANDLEMKGKEISCETTGSCKTIRSAYKQELKEQREKKRHSNVPTEENYLDLISGNKAIVKKDYSPFKKQQPPQSP
jgi:hypothetical protein